MERNKKMIKPMIEEIPEFTESINSMPDDIKNKVDQKIEAMYKSPHNCTLTDSELFEKAESALNDLIKTGGKSFTMQVPARPNHDTDLILSEVINRFKSIQAKCDRYEKVMKQIIPYLSAPGTNGNHWVPVINEALSGDGDRICPNCKKVFNADRNGCCRECGSDKFLNQKEDKQ